MNLLHQHFEARAFFPEWGNEVIEGTIVLSTLGLRFESSRASLEIPMDRLVARVPEADEERITFTDRGQPGLEIFTTDLDLLECVILPPIARAQEELSARLSRRELNRRLRILAYCALVCVAVTYLASLFLGFMVRSIAARIPPDWDAAFGTILMEGVGREAELKKDTNAVARIEALAAPLLQVLPQTTNGYRFHVVEDSDPNAFALPGGHIVVHTGLLELADSEELLGVLAHEVAHVTQRHIYRKAISTAGPLMICGLFFGSRGGLAKAMGGGAALMVGAGFSQDYETEADNAGWDYLVAANINPRGMIRMFEKLKRHDESRMLQDLTPQAFQSHPALGKRIKRLESRWRKLSRKIGFLELPPAAEVDSQ